MRDGDDVVRGEGSSFCGNAFRRFGFGGCRRRLLGTGVRGSGAPVGKGGAEGSSASGLWVWLSTETEILGWGWDKEGGTVGWHGDGEGDEVCGIE